MGWSTVRGNGDWTLLTNAEGTSDDCLFAPQHPWRPLGSSRTCDSHLELVALVMRDYDVAIRFFVDVLQFELVEDTPSLTNDGCPKRWVVIRPDGGQTGILLGPTATNKHALEVPPHRHRLGLALG